MQQKKKENKNLAEIENIDLREFGPEKIPQTEQNREKEILPEKIVEIGSKETELYLDKDGKSAIERAQLPIGGGNKNKKDREKQIESVLEEGLENVFQEMTPVKQQEFKKIGEETSRKINEILAAGKVKAKRIIELIKSWLSLIPGVNKFFIEQEAKIKTDKILKLSD